MVDSDSEYRINIEFPMQLLADTLAELGVPVENLQMDPDIIEIATKKLRTLHAIAATVLSKEILDAIMKE